MIYRFMNFQIVIRDLNGSATDSFVIMCAFITTKSVFKVLPCFELKVITSCCQKDCLTAPEGLMDFQSLDLFTEVFLLQGALWCENA